MDIEGLGYKTIDLLLREGLIHDPADIFLITSDQLLGFEGFGEISVGNLMRSIDNARHRPLQRVLMALGIRHVGGTVARVLARRFRSLRALMAAPEEEIAATEGVGQVIAASIKRWASEPDNIGLISKLESAGVVLEDQTDESAPASNDLAGVAVVVTGTLDSMSREQAEAAVVERGGKATSGVSKKTTYLVAGSNPGGSKVTKAEELGVPVINEQAFLKLLADGPTGS
ncbi:MAG: helix-hairpin-helix domain-containing protein, partial [Acidimicrobiia bacterium]